MINFEITNKAKLISPEREFAWTESVENTLYKNKAGAYPSQVLHSRVGALD
jgi:hypothetical protein